MDSEETIEQTIRHGTGTVLLLLGGAVAVLIYIDRTDAVDIAWPAFWFRTRGLHLFGCVAAFVGGAWLLRNPDAARDESPDLSDIPVFDSVVVYSKPDCGLCSEAMEVLARYQPRLPEIQLIDISGNRQLEQEHSESIPVVEIDGRVRFRGHVDDMLLQRLLDAAERRSHRADERGTGSESPA